MSTKLLELIEAHPLYKIGENVADRYGIMNNDPSESSDESTTDDDSDMFIDFSSLIQDGVLVKNLQREANKLDSPESPELLNPGKIIGIASLLLGILSKMLSFKRTSGIISVLEQSLEFDSNKADGEPSVRGDIDLQSILIQILPLLPSGLQGQLNSIMPFILSSNSPS